jgi:hypothetical protein
MLQTIEVWMEDKPGTLMRVRGFYGASHPYEIAYFDRGLSPPTSD